ncbi:MAG: hypothetical protein J7K30_09095 [Deltaproteobacteria bacterium]|nr:hypothetical protein [Deltaproteobacteria bacterium]
MKKLELDDLMPGMVLAKPVHNFHELLLLSEGSTLYENNIRILKSWGVTNVWIEAETEEVDKKYVKVKIELQEIIKRDLMDKFIGVLEDKVMVEIMRAAEKVLNKRLQTGYEKNGTG